MDEDYSELEEISESYGVDRSEAEEIRDLTEELGVDEDDAHMIWEAM